MGARRARCFAGAVVGALCAVALPHDVSAGNSKEQNPSSIQERPVTDTQERRQALLDKLKSSSLDDRMAALHALVDHDRSLLFLKDRGIRAVVIDLLRRETKNGQDYDTGERTDFQYYQGFLLEVVQKIATDYNTPAAWKTLVYSNYGPGSPFGQWIAERPESYPLLLDWIDDKDYVHRWQALSMLGEVCANRPVVRPKILPLLREKISSTDSWTGQGAMAGLGSCGTFEDVAILRALPSCSNDPPTRSLCRLMEDKITKRLAEHKNP